MRIYTTYYAQLRKLPEDIVAIPISNRIPMAQREGSRYSDLCNMKYKKLVPPWYVVKEYQENGDESQYTERYQTLVLSKLDPHQVVADIKRYASGKDIALVCYEKSGSFCHRHIVAQWLRDAGYEVCEWG
jgi:uncharacterized protein YeaO (DUF488 family)